MLSEKYSGSISLIFLLNARICRHNIPSSDINPNSPFLQIRDPCNPLLRIAYHLDKEIRECCSTEFRILTPIQIAIVYCFLVAWVAEAWGGSGLGLRGVHDGVLRTAGDGGVDGLLRWRNASIGEWEVWSWKRGGHVDGLRAVRWWR